MKRQLPIFQRLALALNGVGGTISIVLFFVGCYLLNTAIQNIDFEEISYLQGEVQIGKGKITDIYETDYNFSSKPYYGYEYTFDSPVGVLLWTSFASGQNFKVGDEVSIEYSEVRPGINRIQGMTNIVGGTSSFYLLIPLFLSFLWIAILIMMNKKKRLFITNGKVSRGTLVKRRIIYDEFSEEDVYKLTFNFLDENGKKYQVSVNTSNPEELMDERQELLIYELSNPPKAILVDTLPWFVSDYIKKNWI